MDIETLVNNYSAPDHVREKLNAVNVVLLAGISGAGKDTIKYRVLQQSEFRPVVSHTTRAPRANNGVAEQDGREYHFIDEATARTMLEDGGFIEAKYVHGTIYGTSAAEVIGTDDRIALTDVDVQGVSEYLSLSKSVAALFIVPPNYETWVLRLSKRYATEDEFEAEWPRRRASAISELTQALEMPEYHFIINDDLDRSVEVVTDIAQDAQRVRSGDGPAREAAQKLLDTIVSH